MHSLNNKDIVLGIVIPCFNESNVIVDSVKTISSHLKNLILEKKIKAAKFCIVDDGSRDETWNKLKDLSKFKINNISYSAIKFSENFGHQNALIAGMNELYLKTECVITIDADLEQDFKKITEFLYQIQYSCSFSCTCLSKNKLTQYSCRPGVHIVNIYFLFSSFSL